LNKYDLATVITGDRLDALARFLGVHAMTSAAVALAAAFAAVALGIIAFHAAALPLWNAANRWRSSGRKEPAAVGYLGLHLTIGLGLALLSIHLFGELGEGIVEQDNLTRFDVAFARSLHENATLPKLIAFRTIALLANVWTLGVLCILVAGILIWRRHLLRAVAWVIALVGGGLLNTLLKNAFHRLRPALPNPFVTERGWSFPSGHAMSSLIAYGMLAYLLTTALESKTAKRLVIGISIVLVVLIGFSRLYLTVHYFSDVVAGYAAGAFWLLVCISGTEVARRQRFSGRLAAGWLA
jgi:membrane-associated phospholipid phosphatase